MRVVRGRIERVRGGDRRARAAVRRRSMAIMFHPGTDPSRVYYGTDTRAQALLVGAALAALTVGAAADDPARSAARPWLLQASGGIGALVLGVMVVRVDSTGRVPLPRRLPARGGRGGRCSSRRRASRTGRAVLVDPAARRDRRDLVRALPLALAGRLCARRSAHRAHRLRAVRAAHRRHRRDRDRVVPRSSSARSAGTGSRRWVVEAPCPCRCSWSPRWRASWRAARRVDRGRGRAPSLAAIVKVNQRTERHRDPSKPAC